MKNNRSERVAEIKDRLRDALDLRGLKAVDLSDRTGIPRSVLSYYINGKAKPKADRLYIMAKALDVSEAWLLGYDVSMERTEEQKKNDQLAQLIVRLRTEPELLQAALDLAALQGEQFATVQRMLSAFRQ